MRAKGVDTSMYEEKPAPKKKGGFFSSFINLFRKERKVVEASSLVNELDFDYISLYGYCIPHMPYKRDITEESEKGAKILYSKFTNLDYKDFVFRFLVQFDKTVIICVTRFDKSHRTNVFEGPVCIFSSKTGSRLHEFVANRVTSVDPSFPSSLDRTSAAAKYKVKRIMESFYDFDPRNITDQTYYDLLKSVEYVNDKSKP